MNTIKIDRDLIALYEALPTKEHYDAIHEHNVKLASIYADFAVKHFGYSGSSEAVLAGLNLAIQNDGKKVARAAMDPSKYLELLILTKLEDNPNISLLEILQDRFQNRMKEMANISNQ
ncbi:hypothetical protein [Polynucleobacter sp. JS-JIR-5-A7]|uniref:hypothetical protein n=1 Tax=Polynucleobacter sp. JS-JIR-5-A7 TaxID=1758395 RepID=UPI001BFE87C1|nr:hypothetical protein [Polynucleobacter sp. JS-JIR-5-A7]QWE06062.1 hypothetical protein AOC29_08045 [Polynucleobacter sp. JS-JIR-5-A7]